MVFNHLLYCQHLVDSTMSFYELCLCPCILFMSTVANTQQSDCPRVLLCLALQWMGLELPASKPKEQSFPNLSATFHIPSLLDSVALGFVFSVFMVCSFSINLKVPKLPQNKNLHFLSHKHILHNLIAAAVRTKAKGAKRLYAEYRSEHR